MRTNITKKELVQLSKEERHKYIIKNIYLNNSKKIFNYIPEAYLFIKKFVLASFY